MKMAILIVLSVLIGLLGTASDSNQVIFRGNGNATSIETIGSSQNSSSRDTSIAIKTNNSTLELWPATNITNVIGFRNGSEVVVRRYWYPYIVLRVNIPDNITPVITTPKTPVYTSNTISSTKVTNLTQETRRTSAVTGTISSTGTGSTVSGSTSTGTATTSGTGSTVSGSTSGINTVVLPTEHTINSTKNTKASTTGTTTTSGTGSTVSGSTSGINTVVLPTEHKINSTKTTKASTPGTTTTSGTTTTTASTTTTTTTIIKPPPLIIIPTPSKTTKTTTTTTSTTTTPIIKPPPPPLIIPTPPKTTKATTTTMTATTTTTTTTTTSTTTTTIIKPPPPPLIIPTPPKTTKATTTTTTATTTTTETMSTAVPTDPPNPYEQPVILIFSLNMTFYPELLNVLSVAFKTLAIQIEIQINIIMGNQFPLTYHRSIVTSLLPGSIVVNSTLIFSNATLPTNTDITDAMLKAWMNHLTTLPLINGTIYVETVGQNSSSSPKTCSALFIILTTLLSYIILT